MEKPLARLVSTAGHPAVLMPAAAVIASPNRFAGIALAISLGCAALVLAYSLYKTRTGQWAHIDASAPSERLELNSQIGTVFLVVAVILWLTKIHAGVLVVVGLSGLILVVGHLLRRVAKLSLHVAFAVFAALLVWPNHLATVTLVAIALAVSWSRISLHRHNATDVILGALVGAIAGFAFHYLMSRLAT